MKLVCQATCYMPVRGRGASEVVDRFEDGEVTDVPQARVPRYLASGNFFEDEEATVNRPFVTVAVAEPEGDDEDED